MTCKGCGKGSTGRFLMDMMPRTGCSKCTLKHIAYAYVALVEADHGYPEHVALARRALDLAQHLINASREQLREILDQKARAVGHLVHAMEECPDRILAEEIRSAYTAILDGEETPDILGILEKLNVD